VKCLCEVERYDAAVMIFNSFINWFEKYKVTFDWFISRNDGWVSNVN